jgi:hypothetical protein
MDGIGQPAPDGQNLSLGAARGVGQQFHLNLVQSRIQWSNDQNLWMVLGG